MKNKTDNANCTIKINLCRKAELINMARGRDREKVLVPTGIEPVTFRTPSGHRRSPDIKKQKTCTVFLSSYTNTSGSLGEREMLWEHRSRRRVFPQLFRVLPNFHECLYNSIETRSSCFLFLLENNATRKRKTTC